MSATTTKVYTKDKPLFDRLKKLPRADLLKLPVAAVPFCVRTQNALRRAKIETLGELIVKQRFDLLKMQNLGRLSVEQLEAYLSELGLFLGTSPDAFKEPVEQVAIEPLRADLPGSGKSFLPHEKVVQLLLECQRLSAEAATINAKVASLVEEMARRPA